MIGKFFGEREGVTDEARDALPQRVIKALDMIGFPRVLRDRFVLRRRNDSCVDSILVGIERRVLAVHCRQIGPQLFRTVMAAITDVEGNDLAYLLVHGNPDPLFVGLFLHEALHLIGFHPQPPNEHIMWGRYRRHMEMVR